MAARRLLSFRAVLLADLGRRNYQYVWVLERRCASGVGVMGSSRWWGVRFSGMLSHLSYLVLERRISHTIASSHHTIAHGSMRRLFLAGWDTSLPDPPVYFVVREPQVKKRKNGKTARMMKEIQENPKN